MPLLRTAASLLLAVSAFAAEPAPWTCSFDDAALPAGWTGTGSVSVAGQDAFKGAGALVLERVAAEREKPCTVKGPVFPVGLGTWEFACAAATDLESPDASFKGVVTVDLLDAAGKVIESSDVVEPYGKRPWQLQKKRMTIAEPVVSARFSARLDKTIGRFRVDELSAAPVADARKPSAVNRVVFSSPPLGNLFKPEDPRTFTITVESTRELADAERVLTWTVSDYWGAEQAPSATAVAESAGTGGKGRQRYRASIDLAGIPLEVGRYYEIAATVPVAGEDQPFRNWSSFAVLPIAPSKAYPPERIPFTSRTWDNRIGEYLRLADRLGIRIGGIWSRAEAEPPHKAEAPGIKILAENGMGVLMGAPAGVWTIEHHGDGYQKWTEEALRGAIRSWYAEFGKHEGPIVVNLGNEPNNTGERLKEAVAAYKIAYDEIKKVSPRTFVVATSIGATDEYFQLGYQDACDAFDFHVYESPANVRMAIKSFQDMMKKYKCEKPVWSTEIGLNSQGMTRQYIAGDMARKTAAFFAAGGANMSWFGFLYPDPDAKIHGSGADAFNMVDSRYNTYGPRLDAVMHYNLINGILVKKFADERIWKDGVNGCHFRDAEGASFVILWKDKGSADVRLPLPGVEAVQTFSVDGRRSTLDAAKAGVDLTIGEDPLLITYSGGPATLPDALAEPELRLVAAPASVVRGAPTVIEVATTADPARVSLLAPPAWTVVRDPAQPLRFTVTSPEGSRAKAGDLRVRLAGAGQAIAGELVARPAVNGRLGVEIMPVPAAKVGGQPSAKITVRNLAAQPQTVSWVFALTGEQVMDKGEFGPIQPVTAFLADEGGGSLTVPGNGQQSVTVPLSGVDPIRLYHASATITDAAGGAITGARVLGGFAGVPRAPQMKLDGVLDEAAWAAATPNQLDQAIQFFGFKGKGNDWRGPEDLSATMRCLWDDKNLYIGVQVTDDVFANTKAGGDLWAGDGLQFLFDPKRDQAEKPGKYDAGMALGTKGPQAWYWLTASTSVSAGLQPAITTAVKRGERGDATYEVAIPWDRLAPFAPGVGANLGACMIINEDDGKGRASFIGWFGNPHTKQIDTAGDLILLGE